jgi:ABC-type branched-subunit amino acid transport system substrate-binding protein
MFTDSYNFHRYKKLLSLIAIVVLVEITPGVVWAHQFGLVFIAPLSGENVAQGKQALDGFMLATAEEDAHAFEESDGHLGGLDSYVFTVDSAQEPTAILQQLDNLIKAKKPAFITGVIDAETMDFLGNVTDGKNVVLFNPDESAMWRFSQDSPRKFVTVDGQPFSVAMQKKYSYAPDASAYRGYIAARLIAAAVRSLVQNPVDNISTTAKAVKRVQKSLQPD